MTKLRFLNICLCMALFLSLLSSCDNAESDGFLNTDSSPSGNLTVNTDAIAVSPAEDFEYAITDSKVVISKYIGSSTEVSIPSQIEGMPVTKILSKAFFADTDLIAVVVPEGVNELKSEVFYDCSSLTTVKLPSTLTSLGDSVFANCTSLQSLIIPNLVTELPARCFYGCTALNSVTMGANVTKFGDYCFAMCNSIFGMTLSNSLESIGEFTFYQCADLNVLEFTGDTTFCKSSFLESDNLILYVKSGSVPQILASEYGMSYRVKE